MQSYLEIAHRNSREIPTHFPLSTIEKILENMEAIKEVISAKKCVQQEHLSHYIHKIQRLYKYIEARYIWSPSFTDAQPWYVSHLEKKPLSPLLEAFWVSTSFLYAYLSGVFNFYV